MCQRHKTGNGLRIENHQRLLSFDEEVIGRHCRIARAIWDNAVRDGVTVDDGRTVGIFDGQFPAGIVLGVGVDVKSQRLFWRVVLFYVAKRNMRRVHFIISQKKLLRYR